MQVCGNKFPCDLLGTATGHTLGSDTHSKSCWGLVDVSKYDTHGGSVRDLQRQRQMNCWVRAVAWRPQRLRQDRGCCTFTAGQQNRVRGA